MRFLCVWWSLFLPLFPSIQLYKILRSEPGLIMTCRPLHCGDFGDSSAPLTDSGRPSLGTRFCLTSFSSSKAYQNSTHNLSCKFGTVSFLLFFLVASFYKRSGGPACAMPWLHTGPNPECLIPSPCRSWTPLLFTISAMAPSLHFCSVSNRDRDTGFEPSYVVCSHFIYFCCWYVWNRKGAAKCELTETSRLKSNGSFLFPKIITSFNPQYWHPPHTHTHTHMHAWII